MAYRITAFGEAQLPTMMQEGDFQDMGSGEWLTSFTPIPGGGWYDNFGSRDAPKGIQPITKVALLFGEDAADLKNQLDALRAMGGKRRKLSIEYDDGSQRWQWARLTAVRSLRRLRDVGQILPVTLQWETAAQWWYGLVQGSGWTWGDGSWLFGDGTAEFGQESLTFELDGTNTTFFITHGGNIPALNVRLTFTFVGNWDAPIRIINHTTGQQFGEDTLTDLPLLELDTGARRFWAGYTPTNISSISRSFNTLTVVTSAVHNLTDGMLVRIAGTGEYDGDYYPIDVTNTTTFTASILPSGAGYGTVATGTVRRMVSAYDPARVSDQNNWLSLSPGLNRIQVTFQSNPFASDVTVTFYEHFA